ncbi:hypothetical protein [Streptomyces lancefieldiae]|uniref:Secreted protein n=1 Tax=Streptomyces lancefieldiae TaxID=3075520 RepID=A0ABU3ARV8_9ACTN|nr:hypothetical protein [Streptomyces sp. DSM 40712]MDT0612924.1 hypothetical protein [Streptomyces sp. DSM 40712]
MATEASAPEARRVGAGLVLAALLTLPTAAGCDDDPDELRSFADPTAPTRPQAEAADGTDIGACADGDCELLVSEPVTVRFRDPSGAVVTLHVTEVGPDEVAYTVKSGSGQTKGSARGSGAGCVTVLRTTGTGNSCGVLGDRGRPNPQPDAVVIQAAPAEDGTAHFDIVSG